MRQNVWQLIKSRNFVREGRGLTNYCLDVTPHSYTVLDSKTVRDASSFRDSQSRKAKLHSKLKIQYTPILRNNSDQFKMTKRIKRRKKTVNQCSI